MTTKRTYIVIAAVAVGGAVVGVGGAVAATHVHWGSNHRAAETPPGALARDDVGPPFGRGGFGLRRGGPEGLQAAATYLGISTSQLFTDLQSGKSLADIAKAADGKSVQGLVDAMVAAEKKETESAVNAGTLTRDEADHIESNLEARVTEIVNGTFHNRHGSGFGPPRPPGTTL
jgi:hypothetical protein